MRIAILDEESNNLKLLETYLKKNMPNWNVVAYKTVFSLVTGVYDDYKGDIDAMMIHVSGQNDEKILMARDIQNYFPQVKVVFYSEKNNLAEEIFNAAPVFFVRLPFSDEKLNRTVNRVNLLINHDYKRLFIFKMNGKLFKLSQSSIHYIESSGRKILLYTDDGYYETYMTVEETLDKLPSYFFRCHRSYIVNLDRISKMDGEGLILNQKEFVPVSRSYIQELRKRINQRL